MIPTRPAGSGNNGTTSGVPTVQCGDAATDGTYELPLVAQWNPAWAIEAAAGGDISLPALVVGCAPADITPAPAWPLQQEVGLALTVGSIAGKPTREQVPGQWLSMGTSEETADGPAVGQLLPVDQVQGVVGSADFWLRLGITDANGCENTVYAYLPDGAPLDPAGAADPVTVYVLGDDGQELTFTPANPPANDEAGVATAAQTLTVHTVCPAPAEAVAVAQPACADPFRVAIVSGGSGGGGTTEVTGPAGGPVVVSGAAGAPVPVAPKAGLCTTQIVTVESPDEGTFQAADVPDGWSKIVVRGGGQAGSSVRLGLSGGGWPIDVPETTPGVYGPLTFDAPAGCTMADAIVLAAPAGGGPVTVTALAVYPPA